MLLYSRPPNDGDHHRNEVLGIMLTKKANRSLAEWEPINEGVLKGQFWSKFQQVSIIQCYAPTTTADQEV